MKKNKMMRLASSLLVAVLLTTSVISGTFAKYVTSDEASDSARVAKWGVVVKAEGNLFDVNYYQKNDPAMETDNQLTTDEAYISVESVSSDAVLAPGTKSDDQGLSLSITGKPEVDIKVTTIATIELENWELASGEYCPLVFKVDNTEYKIDGSSIINIDGLKTALKTALEANANGKIYESNTDLSTVTDIQHKITWEWPFETGNDVKDTELGNRTTKGLDAPTVSIKIETTVEQVD